MTYLENGVVSKQEEIGKNLKFPAQWPEKASKEELWEVSHKKSVKLPEGRKSLSGSWFYLRCFGGGELGAVL